MENWSDWREAPARCSRPPILNADMQIHIGADASDAQIDAVFKSMAKHLYGKG